MQFFITLCLLILASSNFYVDVHWGPWFTLNLFGVAALTVWITKRSHWSVGLFSFWCMFSSLKTFAFWHNFYFGNPDPIMSAINSVSAQAFAGFVMCAFLIGYLSRPLFNMAIGGITIVTFLQGLLFLCTVEKSYIWPFGWVTFPEIFHMDGRLQGLFGNTAMAACVSALGIPWLLDRKVFRWKSMTYVALLTSFAVVYVAQSSMAFLMMLLAVATYYFIKSNSSTTKLYVILGLAGAAIALGNLFDYQFFQFQKIDRFHVWPIFIKFWYEHFPIWTGAGNGTFWFLGPIIQMQTRMVHDQGFWVWMHNDWLQLLFEEGIVGFLLGLNVFVCALVTSWRRRAFAAFSSVLTYSFLCFGMYPTNLAFTGLFGMMILRDVYELESQEL